MLPETSGTEEKWGGKLIGHGDWPLGSSADCRMWIVSEFGLAIYAAKGYTIQIQYGQTPGLVQVEPGYRDFRRFMAAMEEARGYAIRRGR